MSTPAQIKNYIKLLELPGIAQVIHECVREVLSDTNQGEDVGVGEVALARYSSRIILRVKGKLKTQLRVEDIRVHQVSIEEIIEQERMKEQAKNIWE